MEKENKAKAKKENKSKIDGLKDRFLNQKKSGKTADGKKSASAKNGGTVCEQSRVPEKGYLQYDR